MFKLVMAVGESVFEKQSIAMGMHDNTPRVVRFLSHLAELCQTKYLVNKELTADRVKIVVDFNDLGSSQIFLLPKFYTWCEVPEGGMWPLVAHCKAENAHGVMELLLRELRSANVKVLTTTMSDGRPHYSVLPPDTDPIERVEHIKGYLQ